jgi:hypothetical protein
MKINDIITEVSAGSSTGASSIATMVKPIGTIQKRKSDGTVKNALDHDVKLFGDKKDKSK